MEKWKYKMLFYQKGWRKKSFTWDKVHAILYFRHARKALSESANLKQAAVYRYPPLKKKRNILLQLSTQHPKQTGMRQCIFMQH